MTATVIKGHNFEEDTTSNDIGGFTCTKCGIFKFWLMGDIDECTVKNKEPYIDGTDYSKLDDHAIKQMLSSGNRDYYQRKR